MFKTHCIQSHCKPRVYRSHSPSIVAVPREAATLVPLILDEATKARSRSIQLKGMDFAGELSSQLLKHGSEMESFYSILKTSIQKPSPDRKEIKKLLKKVKAKRAWFEKAEVRCCKTIMMRNCCDGNGTKPKSMLVTLFDSSSYVASNL